MDESQRALWRTLERQHGIAPYSGLDAWAELIERSVPHFHQFKEKIVLLCIHEIDGNDNGNIYVPIVTTRIRTAFARHTVVYGNTLNKLQWNGGVSNATVVLSTLQRRLVADAECAIVIPYCDDEFFEYQVDASHVDASRVHTATSSVFFSANGHLSLSYVSSS